MSREHKDEVFVQEKAMKCVFHWLNCLYRDFLTREIAGGQMPCSSCPEVKNCDSCPPYNFNLAGEKFGLKIDCRSPKSR